MFIYTTDYEGLPAWVDKNSLSDNGCGKDYAHYLIIEDGEYKKVYSDAMEPEDVKFYRDLSWVALELQRDYGKKDINEI